MQVGPRRGGRFTAPVVVLSLLLVIALGAWWGVDYLRARLAGNGCDALTPVEITAAPNVAPVLTRLAKTVPQEECFSVNVTPKESAEVADLLGTTASGGPDVWVPESSTMLSQARDSRRVEPAGIRSVGGEFPGGTGTSRRNRAAVRLAGESALVAGDPRRLPGRDPGPGA